MYARRRSPPWKMTRLWRQSKTIDRICVATSFTSVAGEAAVAVISAHRMNANETNSGGVDLAVSTSTAAAMDDDDDDDADNDDGGAKSVWRSDPKTGLIPLTSALKAGMRGSIP